MSEDELAPSDVARLDRLVTEARTQADQALALAHEGVAVVDIDTVVGSMYGFAKDTDAHTVALTVAGLIGHQLRTEAERDAARDGLLVYQAEVSGLNQRIEAMADVVAKADRWLRACGDEPGTDLFDDTEKLQNASRFHRRATATGGGPCERCGTPRNRHVCLSCSPTGDQPGPGCINCRHTGWDQTPCQLSTSEPATVCKCPAGCGHRSRTDDLDEGGPQ